MATTQEINDSIIAEKESGNYPELDVLDSTSKVAIWRLWVWIFSFASKAVLELFESFKTHTEDVFAKNQQGTILWWNMTIREWQFGDALEFIDGLYQTTDYGGLVKYDGLNWEFYRTETFTTGGDAISSILIDDGEKVCPYDPARIKLNPAQAIPATSIEVSIRNLQPGGKCY